MTTQYQPQQQQQQEFNKVELKFAYIEDKLKLAVDREDGEDAEIQALQARANET